MKVTTEWKKGEAFKSTYNNAHIEMDSSGGFSPKALLLSGLAGCAGVDMVMILEKMRVQFSSMNIDVETEQTEDLPKIFQDIHVYFKIATEEANRDKVQKAVDLSMEKYCGVAAMLRKNSEIHTHIEIITL